MAPKSKRSPSPKKKAQALGFDEDEDKKTLKKKEKEEKSKDEARAGRWLEASKPKYIQFDGPRPDEEFLQAIRVELEQSKIVSTVLKNESIEQMYALHRTGMDHRLQDERPLGPERLLTVDINQRSINGYTSLHMATAAGNREMVAFLLERFADVGLASVTRAELPIHFAAQAGYDLIVQQLVGPTKAKGLIDAVNMTGWNSLHFSVAGQNRTVMSILLRAGAKIDSRNDSFGGITCLHMAARLGYLDYMEALIDREADPNVLDHSGRSALHWSAQRADPKAVSMMLRNKADVNLRGAGGSAAIELVPVEHECREKVILLLQAYARKPPAPVRTDVHFELDERPGIWDIPVLQR
mmetsp:Transcript_846/g.1650  ORF Transcript_846/g.1650 Transcript_846/m.1650 type:complete len:354 (-) Transcript_846:94-1155(-)|eukprot:CAMPEP_0197632814 /NCGR_PEP_ID=MMETSP1338-20131121/9382_1 /TAXON_ID=43686 ORGANISM="Pelagodinium beii, Strain RCC1491" /NCGR_SAMPLE_ID=MMETSP1338 /ASSEMBLY_ACC=CAM_ASM_000754 /LENGTH=353 /DNA_ID=CAMNT_0043204385 /DNA_START=20 /DNA_END=1081 /DNA_ORIENTATION=+